MRVFVYEYISAGAAGLEALPESLRSEGAAMLAAVVADFRRVPRIEVVTLEGASISDEAVRFRALAGECDATLVIAPEFDDVLASRSQAVLDAGGRLLGSSPAAIRRVSDKLHLAQMWHERGVAHPATSMLGEAAFDWPWVVKPRIGAGSQATFLIAGHASLEPALVCARQEWPHGEWIIQQYVAGQPASVALLIGPQQTIALAPVRQHLSSDGRFRYEGGSLPLPAALAQRATRLALRAVADVEGLHGYTGVDLVLGGDGVDYAIEINPRLTTSYIGLRQCCQQNIAELLLRLAAGVKTETPAWSAGEVRFKADGFIHPQIA